MHGGKIRHILHSSTGWRSHLGLWPFNPTSQVRGDWGVETPIPVQAPHNSMLLLVSEPHVYTSQSFSNSHPGPCNNCCLQNGGITVIIYYIALQINLTSCTYFNPLEHSGNYMYYFNFQKVCILPSVFMCFL